MAPNVVLNKDDASFSYVSSKLEDKNIFPYVRNDKVKGVLPGKYNESNAAAAVAATGILGISEAEALKAIASFKMPSGRLEKINKGQDFEIYVDFAHTPNALEEVLTYLSKNKKGKLIAVFGSAGERDAKKRPMMGEISGRLADTSIFTAEDPRSEDVSDIISQIAEGAKKAGGYFIAIPERGEAIAEAIKLAKKGDTVVICGKGHEKSMAYNGVEYPWSDQEAVAVALEGGVKKIEK